MADWLIKVLIAIATAIAVGLIVRFFWEHVFGRGRLRLATWLYSRRAVLYDPRDDGMFAINSWSPNRPLTPRRLQVRVSTDRPRQTWIDSAVWDEEYAQVAGTYSGSCGYVTRYDEIDFREGPTTEEFRVVLSPCDYAEGLATWRALEGSPDEQAAIKHALATEPRAFVESAPPMPLAINVAILSPDGRFLATQRSSSVATSPNVWTVGPSETLVLPQHPTPGDSPEDFFSLAERCLREEVGLARHDYGEISISWFGYYAVDAHPWVFAQVRAKLPEPQIEEQLRQSHSAVETSGVAWLPLTRRTVRAFIAGERDGSYLVTKDLDNRRWTIHGPTAVSELWRMQARL